MERPFSDARARKSTIFDGRTRARSSGDRASDVLASARLGFRPLARQVPRMIHRIEPLAAQQVKRCFPIQHDVVEWVREDLGEPHCARLYATRRTQPEGARHEPGEAEP